MKKSMLCAGLMTILCATVQAEVSDNLTQADSNSTEMQSTYASASPAMENAVKPAANDQGIQTPASQGISTPAQGVTPAATANPATSSTPAAPAATENKTPAIQGTPVPAAKSTTTPATTGVTPTTPNPAGTATPTAPAAPQKLDCNYRIPAETNHIDPALVMKWAEKAAEQSFDFNHQEMQAQLASLKACFTDQGWQGYNDALQKSGNMNAIQSQQLMVSSMVNGEATITEVKDNQWKVTLPLQVVYQNEKEKLTQPLTINLIVGRKVSGDLGIMQMIAVPRQSNSPDAAATKPAASTTPLKP